MKRFEFTDKKVLLLCFFLGFIIRLVPEIISYPHPIGFDTIGYAASISTGKIWYQSGTFFEYPWNTFFSTWMLYLFLVPIHSATKIDPFLLLKFSSPLLYAFNVCAVFVFSRKWLNWSIPKAILATIFFAVQLASLRSSWDLYRNSLAMIFFLLALPLVYKAKTLKGFVSFALLSLLVVFSHELVAAVLLILTVSIVTLDIVKRKNIKRQLMVLAAALPALICFVLIALTMSYQYGFTAESNIVSNSAPNSPYNAFFIVNYLKISSPMENYPTYISLLFDVFGLFGILYLLWLPLIRLGFFRNKLLDILLLILLAFTFSSIIFPFFAIFQWSRWMYLLAYPFAFYAANGAAIRSRLSFQKIKPKLVYLRSFSRLALVTLVVAIALGSLFMVLPSDYAVFSVGRINSYLPSTMQQNTLPLQDQNSLIDVMQWLNNNAAKNSSILLHYAFVSWARLYLGNDSVWIYYMNINDATNYALQQGYSSVYLMWWTTNNGWYGIIVPDHFHPIFSSGRLSVFQYK